MQNGDGKYVVAEQCRPSTVMTLRGDDVVGDTMPDDMTGELDAAMQSSVVFRSTVLRTVGKATGVQCIRSGAAQWQDAWLGGA